MLGFLPWEKWLPPYVFGPLICVASTCVLGLERDLHWWNIVLLCGSRISLRPDVWLALLAGLATMLLMQMNPDLPEQMRLILIIVPSIFAVVVALKVASALALYWTTTNCYSAVQTAVLHHVVARRIRSGSLKI